MFVSTACTAPCDPNAQAERAANDTCLRHQPQLTCGMRAILLDWLVEVARRYRQAPETVFQATSLVDRFLATGRVAVSRDNFQCFGSVCLVLASKVEEAYRTEVTYEDLNEMCAGAYTKQQLASSEAVVLNGRGVDGAAPPSAHAGFDAMRLAASAVQPSATTSRARRATYSSRACRFGRGS